MISWDTCKCEFEWDGSWRDIYITPASLDDWKTVFRFLRIQPDVEFIRESGAAQVPEFLDTSFFGRSRSMIRFRVGGVLFVFHFFTTEEVECDIDPREVTGQSSLDAVLGLMRQIGGLTHKCAVLTSENGSDRPIISYDPSADRFEYHGITA